MSAWEGNEIHIPAPIVTIFRDIISEMDSGSDLVSACNSLAKDPPSGPHRFEYAPGVECVLIPTATLPPATHTNCFVLGERGGMRAIVDPAIRDEEGFEELKSKVGEIKADGSEILCTIFTHRHQDHLGDMSLISRLYEAPVWASSETLEAVSCLDSMSLAEGDTISLKGPSGESIWEVIETPRTLSGPDMFWSESQVSYPPTTALIVGNKLVPSTDGDLGAYISGTLENRDLEPHKLFPGPGPIIPNP
jgi:Zn-dependent hydrolases, including glyoxylases